MFWFSVLVKIFNLWVCWFFFNWTITKKNWYWEIILFIIICASQGIVKYNPDDKDLLHTGLPELLHTRLGGKTLKWHMLSGLMQHTWPINSFEMTNGVNVCSLSPSSKPISLSLSSPPLFFSKLKKPQPPNPY